MRVLVVNAGSSSLKLRVLDDGDAVLNGVDLPGDCGGRQLAAAVDGWGTPVAIGHRIVHGGTLFTGPVLIDDVVRRELGDLTALAPLHQPRSLAALDGGTAQWPDVAAVASFDTAFHGLIPAAASTYAIPLAWRERYGIRRYGFHGLSHSYCSHRAAGMVGRPLAELRVVTCHLGAGASLAAVLGGRCVDHDGLHPLGGVRHGDPLRFGRPGTGPVARGTRAPVAA